jgi:hypothetical protein
LMKDVSAFPFLDFQWSLNKWFPNTHNFSSLDRPCHIFTLQILVSLNPCIDLSFFVKKLSNFMYSSDEVQEAWNKGQESYTLISDQTFLVRKFMYLMILLQFRSPLITSRAPKHCTWEQIILLIYIYIKVC